MNNDWREYTGDQDYLAHHGILGQKWGVRRFENKNGHLTPAGKKRYDGDKVSKKEQRAAYNKAYDKWSAGQDKNDAEYRKVQELHKGLGKTGITRAINAARNKSDAAKEYNKAYDKWSKQQDKLDKEWEDVKASKPGLTDKQRKIIGVGMVAVGTGLAAYGGYKLYQLNKQLDEGVSNQYSQKAKEAFRDSRKLSKLSSNDYNIADQIKIRNGGSTELSKQIAKSASEASRKSSEQFSKALDFQKMAQSKNYSLGEKVDYLKSTKSSSSAQNPIDKYANKSAQTMKIRGEKTFIDAAKANDDLVQELLRKNTLRL